MRRERLLRAALPSVLSVATALLLGFLLIAFTRDDVGVALEAYGSMFLGGLGDFPRFFETGSWTALTRPWGEAGTRMALLMLTGLSVAVAFSVGLFNIGAQGQLVCGAIVAAVLGTLPIPGFIHLPLCILAACLAGALWAWIAAWLKVRRGVHEVISTIMLNWIAVSLIEGWLVVGPLRAEAEAGLSGSGTREILASAWLPHLLGTSSRLNAGFPLVLAVFVACWVWYSRSVHGFESRSVGLANEASRAAGIPVHRRVYQAMALSGALAGLAGAVLILGTEHSYPAILGGSLGFDGIAIALIGNGHPLGVGLSAFFFGVVSAGGTRMQLLGVHKSFPELIQGFALLFVAGRFGWEYLLARRRKAQLTPATVEVPRA